MSYMVKCPELSIIYEMLSRGFRSRVPHRQQHLSPRMTEDELLEFICEPVRENSFYSKWQKGNAGRSPKLISDNEKFVVILDVLHFKSEEITIRISNGYIVVEGKHEEKEDGHGYVTRQFVRRYVLPEDVIVENIYSRLSSDGILTITAPRNSTVQGERFVPIQLSHEPLNRPSTSADEHMNSAEEKKEEPKEKESKNSEKDKHLKMLLK